MWLIIRETLGYSDPSECLECGDALDCCSLHGVCSACIADATEVGDTRSRARVARDVAALTVVPS